MPGLDSFLLLSVAVFFGAFVSGLAGFAFSAVAAAILLHVLQPLEAVPLMMACSIGVQATNLWALRNSIRWKESAVLVLGGILGVPLALWLLHNADARAFQRGFGLMIAAYSGYMLFKPGLGRLQEMSRSRTAMVGFGGGVIGGLTAMPGALPTIWCEMHGLAKTDQRGLVQPFIAVMQVSSLAMMLARHELSSKVLVDLAMSLPALLAGTALGILAFRRIKDAVFRKIILGILLLSGLLLVF
ncbi:putative membrane protein YfcA [Bradyrhizobium sp. USDA 4369]